MTIDNGAEAEPIEDAGDEGVPSVAESLDPKRVAELLEAGEAQVIDVRDSDEWAAGHVPGALHVFITEVSERAGEIDRDRTVVFQCAGGNRSAMVADAFRGDGYDAYNMAGGLRAWEEAGLPLEGDEGAVA